MDGPESNGYLPTQFFNPIAKPRAWAPVAKNVIHRHQIEFGVVVGVVTVHVIWVDTVAGFILSKSKSIGHDSTNSRPEIASKVINVDGEVLEQCALYDECNSYQRFITNNKPVFEIEYTNTTNQTEVLDICANCPPTFSTLVKELDLGEWYAACHS
jgi:hypothetical protein